MAFTTDLLEGVAERLHADTVGVWRPTGAYDPGEVGIVLGVPTQQPDSLIALAVYTADDHPALSDSTIGMQVRLRGPDADTRKADELADAVFDTLQGLHGAALGSVRLVYARRRSTLPLGVDGNGRHERADNWDLTVWRPSAHRE